jgi:hypothetical protein
VENFKKKLLTIYSVSAIIEVERITMDKELAKQLNEIEKINNDSKVIRETTKSITELMNELEV